MSKQNAYKKPDFDIYRIYSLSVNVRYTTGVCALCENFVVKDR